MFALEIDKLTYCNVGCSSLDCYLSRLRKHIRRNFELKNYVTSKSDCNRMQPTL